MDGRIAISLNVPLLRPGINSEVTVMRNKNNKTKYNTASPRGRRDDMFPPPPMAVRLAADLRPSADRSAVRTSVVAGQLQAASVPIA